MFADGPGHVKRSLARIRVLIDARDEQLLVTGEAFDQWLARYDCAISYSGGPAYDGWALAVGLGDLVRAPRPDYVFRFRGAEESKNTRLRITSQRKEREGVICTRCGKLGATVDVWGSHQVAEVLCVDCYAATMPQPPQRPVGQGTRRISEEDVARLLSQATPEQRRQGWHRLMEWLDWTNKLFPEGVEPPPEVAEARAWIKRFPRLLDNE
jgi:hypothetical protein